MGSKTTPAPASASRKTPKFREKRSVSAKPDSLSRKTASPIAVAAKGQLQHQRYGVQATVGPLAELQDTSKPYPVKLAANLGATKLSLDGKVLGVLSSWGKAPGKLDYVNSIAVDPSDGSIYTVEIKNWRVQKWVKQ